MSGQIPVKPSADGIAASARAAGKGKGPAPVHLWNPPFSGNLDIRIARDGTWFYLGSPINRHALVQLFASILRKDGADYFLVTPVEKVGITVDDAPFVAIDIDRAGDGQDGKLTFTTNVGDQAVAGPDHPIRIDRDPDTGEPAPYVMIRAGLEALIDRKSFYRMIDLGCEEAVDGESWFGVWSGGQFFPLMPAAELA